VKAGWTSAPLAEVSLFLNRGIAPKYLEQGGICILNQRCVRNHVVSFESARRHDIGVKAVGKDRLIRRGDVLVNSTGTGTLGRVAQLRADPKEPTTVDSHVTIVRPNLDVFDPDFFGFAMIAIEDQIKEAGEGCGGQTELGREVLGKRFLVHYPAAKESQRRIVGILGEAFAGLGAMRTNAEASFAKADGLFDTELATIFSSGISTWSEAPLEDVVADDCTMSYGIVQPGNELANGLPIVRPTDLTDRVIQVQGLKRIDPTLAQGYRRTTLKGGDLLLCVRGTTGKLSIAADELKGANVTRGIVPLRFRPDKVQQSFGYYLMRSAVVQKQIRLKTYGVALMQINISDVRRLVMRFPALKEQPQLVETLRALEAETVNLSDCYYQKLVTINELRKSLLHQAFSGNL
jgi:type I restriction enzyme S subunit